MGVAVRPTGEMPTDVEAERRGRDRMGAVRRPPRTWASFDGFYEELYGSVLAVSYALSGSWTVAEEVTQEAFIRAYDRWTRIADLDRPDSWVRTVAANLARSRMRRLGIELRALARLGGHRRSDGEPGLPAEVTDFWAKVRSLPARQAEAVVLHYVDDLPVRGVAAAMGVAEGTVKSHLHRARSTLRRLLDHEEESR